MAPRTAKAKKAAEVKVAENEAPKKGRGKAKNTEETEQEVPEIEIDEKPALTDKKTKKGKKAQENGETQTNGTAEESAPPAKRGRKKKEAEPVPVPEDKSTNGDHMAEEETADAEEQNGDHTESNGNEEAQPVVTGKGRKKAAKKEEKPKETTKGKKAKQASPDVEEIEDKVVEDKPKGKGRGRKPKAEAPEADAEEKTESIEEAKPEPAAKGRKKAPAKPAKEKSPELAESTEETDKQQEVEEKPEPTKKEPKGRKGKKAQAKDEESAEKEPASKKRKVNKKEEKGQGDAKDEEAVEEGDEEIEESKPTKGKRGKKAEPIEADEEPADAETTSKRRRKPAEDKVPAEDKKKAKNKTATNYEEIDFTNHSKNPQNKEWNFKISCWNVDGIRSWLSKGGLDYIQYEKPDILCLQETKCAKNKLPEELTNVPGYHAYWVDSDKDGYAGVGLYTTQLAINVHYGLDNDELDNEGRIITAEYEQFYLVCVYVPNAGRNLVTLPKRLQWNKEFLRYVKELDKSKPVIICGDMNVAHNEIDLSNPKTNRKNAGFTDEERSGMTQLLSEGFVDTFRHFYPDQTGAYTFWTYMMGARARNVGWRLDYFIVSERLLGAVCDNVIRNQVYGSDHCPIALFLHLTSADKPKEA